MKPIYLAETKNEITSEIRKLDTQINGNWQLFNVKALYNVLRKN